MTTTENISYSLAEMKDKYIVTSAVFQKYQSTNALYIVTSAVGVPGHDRTGPSYVAEDAWDTRTTINRYRS